MVGKKSGRALLREEGLQRTDNSMAFSNWPQVSMINQKNYYTEFLKRDDQVLALRLQQEEQLDRRKKAAVDLDRARAQNQDGIDVDAELDEDGAMDTAEMDESKTIVFHIGSQNLRLGFATDALPKTVPMVIARKSKASESEDGEPRPKRVKLDDDAPSEEWFGEDFAKEYNTMAAEFKTSRRQNKRRVLPNSRELVTKWNSTNPPEMISEHNDPLRIDWTEIPNNPAEAPDYLIGDAALRIPEKSKPRYKLSWPVRYGFLNERDYQTRTMLYRDFFLILEESIRTHLGVGRRNDWSQYRCVFLIPDLYEKNFVVAVLDEFIRDFGFSRVCFMQESLAASFGAGYGIGCIVDMGAQKTSVCCVEDGMCIEESRINMKYGGYDVTETFMKMMLFDRFNYSDLDLLRRHDFLLAEELKEKYTTLSDENITVQLYDFHLRAHGQETRKYQFKIYDEGMLAPMGFFRPAIFDNSEKLIGRRKLIQPSIDLYDGRPNDPMSEAQLGVIAYVGDHIPSAIMAPPAKAVRPLATPMPTATPGKSRPLGLPSHLNGENDGTPRSSVAGSPAPDDRDTPMPNADTSTLDISNPTVNGPSTATLGPDTETVDRTVPVMPLDLAILNSINAACSSTPSSTTATPNATDERRRRELLGSIMLIGGASKTTHLQPFLEARLRALLPQFPKEILVSTPPRDLDPAVLAWKGGSVFGKLRMTNDAWIGATEFDRLGSRVLNYKCMWHW